MKATRERKKKNEIKKEHIMNFKLDIDLKTKYQNYCLEHGYSTGKRIRVLIKADLEGKIKFE